MTRLVLLLLTVSSVAFPQRGGFVVTLGADTVQVESFARVGNRISGEVAIRSPSVRLMTWAVETDAQQRPTRYEHQLSERTGDGWVRSAQRVRFEWDGTRVNRVVITGKDSVAQTIPDASGAIPFGTIPLGAPFRLLEVALGPMLPGRDTLRRLPIAAQITTASRTAVRVVTRDSLEVDYFGQGSFGLAFDSSGSLLRSDWRRTTYQVLVKRADIASVTRVADDWLAAEASGGAFGRLSTRDSTVTTIGDARVVIDYSRPARRGRDVWGTVVPAGRVWRLGADMATHLSVSAPIRIGTTNLEAGTYTLWLIPTPTGATLIVNKRTRIFGTQYDGRQDLAHIPMTVHGLATPVERLLLGIANGALMVQWGERAYSASITAVPPSS